MSDEFKANERRRQVADWGSEAVRILEREGLGCACDYVEETMLCDPEPKRYVTRYDSECPTHWPMRT